MPYELILRGCPIGWSVKILDRERLEPPHVTIRFRKVKKGRLCLRSLTFLDDGSTWNDIDESVRQAIEANLQLLRDEWGRMYPHNPV